MGCGPQEEFRACADVSITDATGHAADTPWKYAPTEKPIDIDDETGTEDNEVPGAAQRLLPFLIGGLVAALLVLAALYVYFYHLSDIVKKSLQKRKGQVHPPSDVKCVKPSLQEPVAPPRTRRSNPPAQISGQFFDEKKQNNNPSFIY